MTWVERYLEVRLSLSAQEHWNGIISKPFLHSDSLPPGPLECAIEDALNPRPHRYCIPTVAVYGCEPRTTSVGWRTWGHEVTCPPFVFLELGGNHGICKTVRAYLTSCFSCKPEELTVEVQPW